ncbi:hypothetical protein KR009_005050 [Drosophila setifemur]|nr:hypothetical protein KR009_005050 [Drosophila setifemur]
MSGPLWVSLSVSACLLFLLGLLHGVAGNGFSTQYRGHTQHPTIPKHCLYEELDLAVPLGDFVLPTDHEDYCVRVECTEDYLLMIRHCERYSFPQPGCHFSKSNYGLQFPSCCPQLECSDGF